MSPHLPPRPQSHKLGQDGEHAAMRLLEKSGCRILAANWRYGHLELDIVCQDGDNIVFVEVKTRKDAARGGAISAVTPAKMRRLCRAALAWLKLNDAWGRPCRFDVICATGQGKEFTLEHFVNAFPLSHSLDRGNAPWQPW